jgi:hypothetical protein
VATGHRGHTGAAVGDLDRNRLGHARHTGPGTGTHPEVVRPGHRVAAAAAPGFHSRAREVGPNFPAGAVGAAGAEGVEADDRSSAGGCGLRDIRTDCHTGPGEAPAIHTVRPAEVEARRIGSAAGRENGRRADPAGDLGLGCSRSPGRRRRLRLRRNSRCWTCWWIQVCGCFDYAARNQRKEKEEVFNRDDRIKGARGGMLRLHLG